MREGASQTHVHHATKAHVHQYLVEIIETQSPPYASNQTVKRLRNMLKDTQVQIMQLRQESREMKTKIKEHLDSYEVVIDKIINMVKISFPLHH